MFIGMLVLTNESSLHGKYEYAIIILIQGSPDISVFGTGRVKAYSCVATYRCINVWCCTILIRQAQASIPDEHGKMLQWLYGEIQPLGQVAIETKGVLGELGPEHDV